ncbi:MAG: hypothetical protein AAF628_24950 [Planctomycetota bacterium]
MDTLYFVCAAVGGSVLVVQTLLLMLGMGHDVDVDGGVHVHDVHDAGDGFFKFLSLKTLVAFLTFFGLAGLAAQRAGWGSLPTLATALGAGAVSVLVVGWLMSGFAKLQSRGNVDLTNAVGAEARVYLRIPAESRGVGKVHVEVQGRRVECKARTRGAEIPTGATVTVVAASSQDTVEVMLG